MFYVGQFTQQLKPLLYIFQNYSIKVLRYIYMYTTKKNLTWLTHIQTSRDAQIKCWHITFLLSLAIHPGVLRGPAYPPRLTTQNHPNHNKMQLDVVMSPSAFVWDPKLNLTHVTFDLDQCDLSGSETHIHDLGWNFTPCLWTLGHMSNYLQIRHA